MPLNLKDLFSGGLKGIGDTAKDIIKQVGDNKLSRAEADILLDKEINRHEEMMADKANQVLKLEVEDRASARGREAEFVKATGHIDYLMWFLVIAAMLIFGFMVWAVVTGEVPEKNRELIFHIFGLVEGAMLTNIFNYYFGSSAGSRIKDMKK